MASIDTDLRCYLTNAGIGAENNAIQLGRKLPVKEMVFGSGTLADGEDPRKQTEMIAEQFAVPCAMIWDEATPTLLTFKGDIPVDIGGFHIGEVAIRLEDGTLYGYARGTGDYKPTPEQGATESVRYVVDMYTTNASAIECTVDLSSLYVDYEDLDRAIKAHDDQNKEDFERKDNAATDEDIAAGANSDRHVKLPQFWRGVISRISQAVNGKRTEYAASEAALAEVNRTASKLMGSISADGIIAKSPKVITESETIPENHNATIIGPRVTIARGVKVSVGKNSTLTVR